MHWLPYAIVIPFALAAIFVNQIDKLLTRFEGKEHGRR